MICFELNCSKPSYRTVIFCEKHYRQSLADGGIDQVQIESLVKTGNFTPEWIKPVREAMLKICGVCVKHERADCKICLEGEE